MQIKVAVIGSGNIGVDLVERMRRDSNFEIKYFIGVGGQGAGGQVTGGLGVGGQGAEVTEGKLGNRAVGQGEGQGEGGQGAG